MNNWNLAIAGLTCAVMALGCSQRPSDADVGKGPVDAKTLEAELEALRDDIINSLPAASEEKLAAYRKACDAASAAIVELDSIRQHFRDIDNARGLVGHAKRKWIGGADNGIAKAQEMLKAATTDAERQAAEAELKKWQENRQEGVDALNERQGKLDKLLVDEPALKSALPIATARRAETRALTIAALKELGSGSFLPSDKIDAFLAAYEAERESKAKLKSAKELAQKVNKARGQVSHAKDKWIAGADKKIAEAEAKLKAATTDAERNEAQAELATRQKDRQEGVQALEERTEQLNKLLAEVPDSAERLKAAEEELASAQARTLGAYEELGLETVLGDDSLDDKFAKFVVMLEATPKALAEAVAKGGEEARLVRQLLGDTELMKQMVLADGPRDGKYAAAMKIYTDIQKASPKAGEGTLQRLALGVSLEHAVPIKQRNARDRNDAPEFVDPVKRYLAYEKAFLASELDPAFKDLDVWEYRFVVYGEEPDEIAEWGRKMLRNYRPDHADNPDYKWRYVGAVRSEIRYTGDYWKYDLPNQQFFQNILMNGGVCGRRSFFGRFILRAFGIPNTPRPQRGHASLTHWTPEGWVMCLGMRDRSGWTHTRYKQDVDFIAHTQARVHRRHIRRSRAVCFGCSATACRRGRLS